VPITDDKIKELYLLAVEATTYGQKEIPVDIFPFQMTDENITLFTKQEDYKSHTTFWKSLQPRYKRFEENKKLALYQVLSTGYYQVK
jgi:murein L,D-transpeptidase YafK